MGSDRFIFDSRLAVLYIECSIAVWTRYRILGSCNNNITRTGHDLSGVEELERLPLALKITRARVKRVPRL